MMPTRSGSGRLLERRCPTGNGARKEGGETDEQSHAHGPPDAGPYDTPCPERGEGGQLQPGRRACI